MDVAAFVVLAGATAILLVAPRLGPRDAARELARRQMELERNTAQLREAMTGGAELAGAEGSLQSHDRYRTAYDAYIDVRARLDRGELRPEVLDEIEISLRSATAALVDLHDGIAHAGAVAGSLPVVRDRLPRTVAILERTPAR